MNVTNFLIGYGIAALVLLTGVLLYQSAQPAEAQQAQASFITLTGAGDKYIKPVGNLWGLLWPGLATSTTGCLAVRANGWIFPSGSDCGAGEGGGLSAYDAWTHPSAGQSATTSTMILTTGGLVVNAASSTIAGNLTITGNSTTTNATSSNSYVSGTLTAVTGVFTNLFIGAVTIAEYIADTAGAMFTGNTETGITVTYQDADNTVDVVCNTADTSTFGCLTDTDWDTFNNKQDTITAGDALTLTGTDIDFDGGTAPSGELGGTWGSITIDDSVAVSTWNLTTPTITTSFIFDGVTVAGLSGIDTTVITGTAGTDGNCVKWNADGDIVDAGDVCGGAGSVSGGTAHAIAAWVDATTLTATSTLNITAFNATSTLATSTIMGKFSIGSTTPYATCFFCVGSSTPILHVGIDGKVGFGAVNLGATKYTFGTGLNENVNPNINFLVQDATDARAGVAVSNNFIGMKSTGGLLGLFGYNYTGGTALPINMQEFGNSVGISTSSPLAKLSVNPIAGDGDWAFAVGSSTKDILRIHVNGTIYMPAITSALVLTGSDGAIAEYAGVDCTNQFVRDISAAGAGTCATITSADVDLADLTATNGSITFSGTYDGQAARTIGVNLGHDFAWTGGHDFGGSSGVEMPNGTNGTVNAVGEYYFDTDDGQFLIATSTNATYPVVLPTKVRLWGATIASTSPDLISGGRIWLPPQRDGFVIKEIHCAVDGGTSIVVNTSNSGGTTDSETTTCDADGAIDTDVATNNTYAAGSLNSLEIGTVTGTVDYLTIAIYGVYTRE